MSIKANIDEILNDIKQYSPYPEKVKLVAVTKYVDSEVIKEILESGVTILGENRVQIITKKNEELHDFPIAKEWHFIGNLQKNKVKYIASFIHTIHSVNKLSLAQEIDKRALEHNKKINVLLEINFFEEETKEGYRKEELVKDIPALLMLQNINIKGLMVMAPYTTDENLIRDGFKKIKELKDELNTLFFNNTLTELSMGMSNDYKIALEEGSTLIRIGTKITK